jgi:adenosine deaminase
MTNLHDFIRAMPKVELHVHLEGSTQPEAVLHLAQKHGISLPADTVEGIREWYTFRDFPHFIEVYLKISECIRTVEDIEWLGREFLKGQAAQNIRYTEFIFTPYTHFLQKGLSGADQLDALNRARAWAQDTYGIGSAMILDIDRMVKPEEGVWTAELAVRFKDNGVVALGIGGNEVGYPCNLFRTAIDYVRNHGLVCIPHAGETAGPESILDALEVCDPPRLLHGVRCIEDPALVSELVRRQTPLDACPTSNLCLGVYPSLAAHSLSALLEAGLNVTLNSDDPPMFNTTLTDEWLRCADAYGWDSHLIERLMLNAVRGSRQPDAVRSQMEAAFRDGFAQLRQRYGV